MSFIFVFWFFNIWGLADPGGASLPRASQFLGQWTIHSQALYSPTNINQQIQSPHPNHLLYQLSRLGLLFPCPNHPTSRYQATWAAPRPQSPLKLFKIVHLKPAYLPCPLLPRETTIKALVYIVPAPSASDQPGCFLMWPWWHGVNLCLEISEYNKLPFQWQSSPDLSAPLYINNNKSMYIKRKKGRIAKDDSLALTF